MKLRKGGITIPTWAIPNINNDDWFTNHASAAYTRFMWKQFDVSGNYDFNILTRWISAQQQIGLRPAFRVMSSVVGQTASPDRIFINGVVGVPHLNGLQIDPVYWSDKYLIEYEQFVTAMGIALDGGDGIEFIDAGGIGVWGEMQFELHRPSQDMWTNNEMIAHGYSPGKLYEAYVAMINMYQLAFPKTQIIINVSSMNLDVVNYCNANNVGIRFDGLNPERIPRSMPVITEIFNSGDKSTRGPRIYEFRNRYNKVADIENCLNWCRKSPLSYLNINLGNLRDIDDRIKRLVLDINADLGFNFSITNGRAKFSGLVSEANL